MALMKTSNPALGDKTFEISPARGMAASSMNPAR